MPYIPDVGRLLSAGAGYSDERAAYVIEPHSLGQVVFPTGQVVGCDPLVSCGDAPPFIVTVPAGEYLLRAWVAVLYRGGTEWQRRVAALQLAVQDGRAARWEPALVDGQDLSALDDDAYFGYPVDSGTGTLADMVALRAMANLAGIMKGLKRFTFRQTCQRHRYPAPLARSPTNIPGRTS